MNRQELEARLLELAPYEREHDAIMEQLSLFDAERLMDWACMEGFMEAREDDNGQLRLFPVCDPTALYLPEKL